MKAGRFGALALLVALTVGAASPPWRKDPKQWAQADVERVLNESPWAQNAAASFPDTREGPSQSVYDLPGAGQAGLPAPKNAATDGKWDGGVSRNTGAGMLPTLSVLVRWDSALPVRQATLRARELGLKLPSSAGSALEEPKSYVLTVIGLIPAKQYEEAGTLPKRSTSETEDGTRPPVDTEQVLEGLMSNTRLLVRGKPALRPEDVKLDPETGVIHVFFPRSFEISKGDKEVIFSTRFGSLNLDKRFRLADMMYQSRLEL